MKDVMYFKNKLEDLKSQLHSRIHSIEKDIKHEGLTPDWTDQASERENDVVLDTLGHHAEVELLKIDAALDRLALGEYELCSACGDNIPAARHELLPFTTLCVHCAEKIE